MIRQNAENTLGNRNKKEKVKEIMPFGKYKVVLFFFDNNSLVLFSKIRFFLKNLPVK